MQWLVQNSGLTLDALDRNTAPLVEAIQKRGMPLFAVGVSPFTGQVTNLEEIDLSVPTMFYGSNRLVELAPALASPGAFFKKKWFDPGYPVGKNPFILNIEQTRTTAGQLRRTWIKEPIFIKSADPKVLTGMVIEPDERDQWTIEYGHLDGNEVLMTSRAQKIDQEWRFFIVNNKVVAGSQYRLDGILRIREPIPQHVWDCARAYAECWKPCSTIVMDMCRIGEETNESLFILEFNCINSSGFYNCDVGAIVDALEELLVPVV